jgi:restriction endonuclease Mrr
MASSAAARVLAALMVDHDVGVATVDTFEVKRVDRYHVRAQFSRASECG